MNSTAPHRSSARAIRAFKPLRPFLFAAAGVASISPAVAQSVVPRSPSQTDAPAASTLIDQEQGGLRLTPGSPLYLDPNSFLRWGPFTARPHLDTTFSYATQLRSRGGASENTVIESISPGVLFEIGPRWRLDYTPTLTYYSGRNFKDNLGQSVSLNGSVAYNDWAFTLAQGYTSSSQALLETGRQTDQENFITSIGASHYLNSKLMLQLGFDQSFRSADALTSSSTWSTMDWLNYQVASRLSIGAGIGGGFEDLDVGHDMTYEQVQARVDARIAEKLNLSINGGGEVRQILGAGGDPLVNPIYGASVIYHPFANTTLSLAGNRTVSSSLLPGEITESTDISLGLSQRLLGKLSGTLAGGFRNSRFILSNRAESLNRSDDSVTFSSGLVYPVLRRGTIGVSYSYSENSSSDATFSSTSHQVGLHLGYRF